MLTFVRWLCFHFSQSIMKTITLNLAVVLALMLAKAHTPAATITSSGSGSVIALPGRANRTLDGYWDPRFSLPPGVNGEVQCAAFFRGDLYVGGRFTRAGTSAGSTTRWPTWARSSLTKSSSTAPWTR